jgi:hypothetical protein
VAQASSDVVRLRVELAELRAQHAEQQLAAELLGIYAHLFEEDHTEAMSRLDAARPSRAAPASIRRWVLAECRNHPTAWQARLEIDTGTRSRLPHLDGGHQ